MPLSHGCATMKSVTFTMFSQHPVAEASVAAVEKSLSAPVV